MGFLAFLPLIGTAVEKLLNLIPDPNERAKAEAEGLRVLSIAEAVKEADIIMVLLPDTEQARVGSRTTATFGEHVFDLALGYTYTDDTFRFPVGTGYRITEGASEVMRTVIARHVMKAYA